MTDEFHRHSGIRVELFFEMENAQRLRKSPPHQIHAPGTPGPELRADVVDVSNAFWKQFAREPQMEAGEVGKNRQWRAPMFRFIHESLHGATQRRQPL